MQKNIDLKKIQIYLISLDSQKERRNSFLSWSSQLGFMKPIVIPGIIAEPYSVGLAEAYYNALTVAIKSDEPFIIMEDDAVPNYEDESYIISIPENSDAIYLGGSQEGFNYENPNVHTTNGAELDLVPEHDSIFKVLNMLTTHSILYITKNYAEKCRQECWKAFNGGTKPIDVAFAYELQRDHNIYFMKPIFYQYDLVRHWMVDTTKNVNALDHLPQREAL